MHLAVTKAQEGFVSSGQGAGPLLRHGRQEKVGELDVEGAPGPGDLPS